MSMPSTQEAESHDKDPWSHSHKPLKKIVVSSNDICNKGPHKSNVFLIYTNKFAE